MKGLEITRDDVGDVTVLYLKGELTVDDVPEAKAEFDRLLAEKRVKLVLELSEVEYIGSSGLSALLLLSQQAREGGGELKIAAPRPLTKEAMSFFGLLPVVRIYADVAAAKASFGKESDKSDEST